MKVSNDKIRFTFACGLLLSAAALISAPSHITALAFEKIQGQDKTGKNCERKDTAESSTFGRCENVCKDKEVTRDAENNRWVCSATKTKVVTHPGTTAPIAGTKAEKTPAGDKRPKAETAPKATKAKKN
jgi:hypothetical protein